MTKLLEQAVEAARKLTPEEQDEIARMIFGFASEAASEPVPLTAEQRDSIAVSREQAKRGEFASEAEMASVWAKFG